MRPCGLEANAYHDNGISALPHQTGARRRDDGAAHRIARESGGRRGQTHEAVKCSDSWEVLGLDNTDRSASPSFRRPYHYIGASPSSLFLGKGGHELAAEVGDVWDHAAPYQVRGDPEKLEQVFAGLLGRDMIRSPSSIGVLMGVVREPRGDEGEGRW
jgi:hypothetical protein